MIWTEEANPDELREQMIYALLDYHGTDEARRWTPAASIVTSVDGDTVEGTTLRVAGSTMGLRYVYDAGRFVTSAESIAGRSADLTDAWGDVLEHLQSTGPALTA